MAGLGICKDLYGNPDGIGDIIPVDYSSDLLIAVGALWADKKKITCFHNSSSSTNPVTWGKINYIYINYIYKFY
jgi:hypothetical protein